MACSGPEPTPAACAPFQQCGPGCGGCDDGDPCTRDQCIADFTCGHLPLACGCEPGLLSRTQVLRQGDGGIAGLREPRAVAVAPGGRDVYVGAKESRSVTLLTWVADRLRFGARYDAGRVEAVGVSPTGQWLVSGGQDGVGLFSRAADGRLTPLDLTPEPAVGVGVSATHGATLDGTALRLFDLRSGELVLTAESHDASLRDARRLVFTPDGHDILVAGYGASRVTAWRLVDGALVQVSSVGSAPGLDHPDAIAVDATGTQVVTAGFCDHDLALMARHPATGALSIVGSAFAGAFATAGCLAVALPSDRALVRPAAVAFSDTGDRVYASDAAITVPRWLRLQVTVVGLTAVGLTAEPQLELPGSFYPTRAFDFDLDREGQDLPSDPDVLRGLTTMAASGSRATIAATALDGVVVVDDLGLAGSLRDGEGGVDGLVGAHLMDLAPDGRHLYVASRNQGAIGGFVVDPRDGSVAPGPIMFLANDGHAGSGVVSSVEVSRPDGRRVVAVVDEDGRGVADFIRDPESGRLTRATTTPIASCAARESFLVVAHARGSSVYASDFQREGPSCVHHLQRQADGALAFVQTYAESQLAGVEGLVTSEDGNDLYAAAYLASTVVHFRRDHGTGALSAGSSVSHPDLYGVEGLALSPDQSLVFVTNPVKARLHAFDRDPATGRLSLRQTVNGTPTVPLDGALGLAVAPDGRRLFVAAHHADAVAVFDIAASGALSAKPPAIAGLSDLEWVNGLTLSPDGRTLYACALQANAVHVFRNGACP